MDFIIVILYLRLFWKFIDCGLEIIISIRYVFCVCGFVEWEFLDVGINVLDKLYMFFGDWELCFIEKLLGMILDYG